MARATSPATPRTNPRWCLARPRWPRAARAVVAACFAAAAMVVGAPASGSLAAAQESDGTPAPAAASSGSDGEAIRVFVLTMGPGDAVWERFGHNAIWIHDPASGTDRAYNYGLFSFDQPGFLWRFIRGRMEYWMGYDDPYRTIEYYRYTNRSVYLQELNLTPEQRVALRDFLEWNALPENAYYRYDYYLDNCATRVRDAIDRVLGGRLRTVASATPAGETFRSHTARITGSDAWLFLGTMLGSGHPVDEPLTAWDEMFLPMELMEHLREITVIDAEGREVPLVLAEDTVFAADRPDVPRGVPSPARYALAGLSIGGVLAGVGAASRRSRFARATFAALAGAWATAAGVLGTVLAGAWLFTDHWPTYRNENLLQVHPLWLAFALLLVAGALGWHRGARAARDLALAFAALAVAGVVVQVLPGFDQVNGWILALTAPATVGLAWGTLRWARALGEPGVSGRR